MVQKQTEETALVKADPAAMALFRSMNPSMGLEDAGGGSRTPALVVVRNPERSELEDGSHPKKGQIYHSGLKKAFDTALVHFVYAKMALVYTQWDDARNDWNRDGEMKNNLFVGGFLDQDGESVPFMYKIKGMNWSPWIAFQKEVSRYSQEQGIPMLALTTKLWTEEQNNTKGAAAYVIMEKVQSVESDVAKIKMMQESLPMFKTMIEGLILRNLGEPRAIEVKQRASFNDQEVVDMTHEDAVKVDDSIPF